MAPNSSDIYFQKQLVQMTDYNEYKWTIYDCGRKIKWCSVLELGKEKKAFCDLKPWEYKMFWVILGFIW